MLKSRKMSLVSSESDSSSENPSYGDLLDSFKEETLDGVPKDYIDSLRRLNFNNSALSRRRSRSSQFKLIPIENFNLNFPISTLPRGRTLLIDILDSWGDEKFVGFTGIEIFNDNGVDIAKNANISADKSPNQLNREISQIRNLVDGVNQTHDDKHMWLTYFMKNYHHTIKFTWKKEETIAIIRLWNYSKSRVYANIGIKSVIFYMDQKCIFQGEIKKICSDEFSIENIDEYYETILFTDESNILEKISKNDPIIKLFQRDIYLDDFSTRPMTGETQNASDLIFVSESRITMPPEINNNFDTSFLDDNAKSMTQNEIDTLSIIIHSNWNDSESLSWIAFDAIQVFDINGAVVTPLKCSYLVDGDIFEDTLVKMIDSNEKVASTWFGSFSPVHIGEIQLKLNAKSAIAGLKIWNCNSSQDETVYGLKFVTIKLNGKQLNRQQYLIRKGPGHHLFNYYQIIDFRDVYSMRNFEGVMTGFVYQLNIYSSWGDLYYIGLNGLELYDKQGQKIASSKIRIYAAPESINILPKKFSTGKDERTPEKLIDGINIGQNINEHCWLAPILPSCINKIFVVFDKPTSLSWIRIWNYSKTPNRGVKDFYVLLDNQIVMRCRLPKVKGEGGTRLSGIKRTKQKSFVVLFNKQVFNGPPEDVMNRDSNEGTSDSGDSEKIKSKIRINQELRPFTSCNK